LMQLQPGINSFAAAVIGVAFWWFLPMKEVV
jgi:hypothetical protein